MDWPGSKKGLQFPKTIIVAILLHTLTDDACANAQVADNLTITWPQLLLTVQKTDSQYDVTLVDPNINSTQVVVTDNGLELKWVVNFPVAVGSAITGIVCHERWTYSCITIKDGRYTDLNVLIGVDDSPNHGKHMLHLELNPLDGAHVMYLEPVRQAVWLVNLKKNKAKLISTFDGQNIANLKVDWTNGLLFTANTSTVSVHGIQTDKLQLHETFPSNATYLSCDSDLRLLYWTDARGSIFKRHYDQREVELFADSACAVLSRPEKKSFSPLYVHNGSIICVQVSGARVELKRWSVSSGSKLFAREVFSLESPEKLLHYNIYTDASINDDYKKIMDEKCSKCSHLCIPVNNTNQFECACPFGFQLLNEFECDTPAVLAVQVEVSEHTKDAPENATHALLLHDFVAVPPSTWTYAYESSPFRIVLSDTFQHLCLQFSANNSVECFSPFEKSSHPIRTVVWTASKDDVVMKVTGDSEVGFDIFFYRDYCLRVYKQKTRRHYSLDCKLSFDANNSFVDHLRYKLYYANEDGLNVNDPSVQLGNGFDKDHKLQSASSGRRQFYLDVNDETALFIPGKDDQLQYITLRKDTFLTRRVGLGDSQSQALIYRNKLLWAYDFRIHMMDKDRMAGAEFIQTSTYKGTEFTVLEKPTVTSEVFKAPNPCRSQTECPHLCKSDQNLQNYECLCPLYLALNGAEVCKPSLLSFALVDDDGKLTLHSTIIGDYGKGKVKETKGLPSLFRFGEIFLHEPNLRRICVAQCGRDGCGIDCTVYGENAKLFKISADSKIILHFVKRHSSPSLKSQDLYWISDESKGELNRMCLNVGSPGRKSSMSLDCFPESVLMLCSHYVDTLSTLFWLKPDSSGSETECRLRGFVVRPELVNSTSEVIEVASFLGNCHGLAVDAKASKMYVLTWLALHEVDLTTKTKRKIRGINFDPALNILKEFNGFIFSAGTHKSDPDIHTVKLFGPVNKTGNILQIYGSSNKKRVVDIHISALEPAQQVNATVLKCSLSCRYHCEMAENSKARCVCPLSAPPTYGPQYQPCSEISPDDDEEISDSMNSSAVAVPWWPVLLGVLIIVTVAGVCQAIFWRRMKRRQDLVFQTAVQNFMQGNDAKAQNAKNESERALHLPFNAVIPPDQLKTTDTCLGEGNFGQVYKGEYKSQDVAVKTVKDNLDNQIVQDFLKELKIMAYVGMHENIVEFFGAEVSEIQKGLVRVVLELCGFGSLESVLRGFNRIDSGERQDAYVLVQENDERLTQDHSKHPLADEVIQVDTKVYHNYISWATTTADSEEAQVASMVSLNQLKKWAQQIASGMEYLERKNVVHGDLATRNVLVCDDLRVKISDFGFSKNMYQSDTYRKKKSCPLPWRWASPETLSRLEFSFKADVWSYGITLWEIFTLGAVPFPDLAWDDVFVNRIQQGMRPPRPQQMPPEMYLEILMPCWNLIPAERPSFSSLANLLAVQRK